MVIEPGEDLDVHARRGVVLESDVGEVGLPALVGWSAWNRI